MPGKPAFDVGAMRKFAQARVDSSSLRAVADEIGISKSGLDHFLKGRNPYSRTRTKMFAWFAQHRGSAPITTDDVDAAIALLDAYVSTAANDAVRQRRVREVTRRLFRSG